MAQTTSAIAYAANLASGLIKGIRLKVYKAVYANPQWTANEIHKLPSLAIYQLDSVRNRFAELEHAQVISGCGERDCRITGNLAITWVVTDYVATKDDFVKNKSRKELEKELAEMTAVAERACALAEDLYSRRG